MALKGRHHQRVLTRQLLRVGQVLQRAATARTKVRARRGYSTRIRGKRAQRNRFDLVPPASQRLDTHGRAGTCAQHGPDALLVMSHAAT